MNKKCWPNNPVVKIKYCDKKSSWITITSVKKKSVLGLYEHCLFTFKSQNGLEVTLPSYLDRLVR